MTMTLSEIKSQHPEWTIKAMCSDMSEAINCASCGKVVAFGDTYTAFEEQTDNGFFGLPICEDCYLPELAKAAKNRR